MGPLGFGRALRGGLLIVTCCIALPATGDDIYFSVEGATQGKIVGEVIQPGIEGKMRALGFSGGIRMPVDPAGRVMGPLTHKQVEVTREPGRGTPQLMHAAATSETLKEVRFDFYAPRVVNGARTMTRYQSIRLIDAVLVGCERMAEPATDPSAGAVRSLERLSFIYKTIEVIDIERNVSAQANWRP